MKRAIALALCGSMVSGCATMGPRQSQAPVTAVPPAAVRSSPAAGTAGDPQGSSVLAEYVQKLPLGMRVRVDRVKGGAIKGILMKATDQAIVVQRRTRVPEPPEEIPLSQVLSVTPEQQGGGIGRAIGAGAAAGAAAALGIILILIAVAWD
jgi:hypothetical protein